jgi:hypothetical protein
VVTAPIHPWRVPRLVTGWRAWAMALVAVAAAGCGSSHGGSTLSSWNPRLTIRPVRATIPQILGTSANALGGAARAGGWHGGVALEDRRRYKNRQVVSGVDERRLVPPPAAVNGVPVFVEVDNVEIVWSYDNGNVPGTDHDTSGNACLVGVHRSNCSCIHIEIDGQWKAKRWAPADFPLNAPIDVQGYIYWDNPHPEEGVPFDSAPSGYIRGHYATGWEIHPVSAWRRHVG